MPRDAIVLAWALVARRRAELGRVLRILAFLLLVVAVIRTYRYVTGGSGSRRGAGRAARDRANASAKARAGAGPVHTPSRAPHEVLGISPTASADEVRRAYQRQALLYHPDKVASAAPELQRLAEQRMKELNAAYREMLDG
ncbi:MAG: J domain-containing protein [Myxococcales bacterium]|nr:J domain-containing protein [Myxococcales bacterium]